MNKYVTLDVVTNYLSDVIKQEVQLPQIKSWAFNYYRTLNLPLNSIKKVRKLKIENGTVALPQDIVKIIGVYSSYEEFQDIVTSFEELHNGNILIQQKTFYDRISNYVYPYQYIGQNNQCVLEYLCTDCAYSFSVNHQLTELFTNSANEYMYIVYTMYVEDNDELLIPDDPLLLQGLAAYVEYMFWKNNLHKHESNAMNIMNNAMLSANTFMKAFKSSSMMKNLNVDNLSIIINKKNKYEISNRY
jgi:hypothetical protein